jgi:ABC-type histidine transport system ATPase subunit
MDARVENDVNGADGGRTGWGEHVDVTVENVEKAFGDTPALHGVSLEIKSGELVALLGPSAICRAPAASCSAVRTRSA